MLEWIERGRVSTFQIEFLEDTSIPGAFFLIQAISIYTVRSVVLLNFFRILQTTPRKIHPG